MTTGQGSAGGLTARCVRKGCELNNVGGVLFPERKPSGQGRRSCCRHCTPPQGKMLPKPFPKPDVAWCLAQITSWNGLLGYSYLQTPCQRNIYYKRKQHLLGPEPVGAHWPSLLTLNHFMSPPRLQTSNSVYDLRHFPYLQPMNTGFLCVSLTHTLRQWERVSE